MGGGDTCAGMGEEALMLMLMGAVRKTASASPRVGVHDHKCGAYLDSDSDLEDDFGYRGSRDLYLMKLQE
jgi:hypothetical protein